MIVVTFSTIAEFWTITNVQFVIIQSIYDLRKSTK